MEIYSPEREYLINVHLKDGKIISDIFMLGADVEDGIEVIKKERNDIKRIVVYDSETRDAVNIIKG